MRIRDWSTDVCSSDLGRHRVPVRHSLRRHGPPGAADRGAGFHAGAALGDRGTALSAWAPGAADVLCRRPDQLGSAACWERVWQSVLISYGDDTYTKIKQHLITNLMLVYSP